MFFGELLRYTYHVQFKEGTVSSFYEDRIIEEPYTGHLKTKAPAPYTVERVKSIGAVSTGFAEVPITTRDFFNESAESTKIRNVTHKDVTSKHFINWFFSLEDWVGNNPSRFPFDMIIHNDEFSVYGYYNGDKLDGIIRVDKYDDYCEISFFCVNQSLQHQGVGQFLFQFALNRFGDKKLILDVYTDNAPAIHIYKKYGFRVTGIGYGKGYNPESPHYIMQREPHLQQSA